MTKLVALVVAALVLTACGADPEKAPSHRLPEVSLANVHGGPAVDLTTFRGPAVVNLWASWCLPCKRELPIYAQFARAHGSAVSVLGIDFQETDEDAARDLLERSRVTYSVVSDPDGAMRAIGLPELLLVDADGKIAYREYVEIKSLAQLEQLVEQHLGVSL